MAEPNFVATLASTTGERLTFRIHCFREPPSDDAALAEWLLLEVLIRVAHGSSWASVREASPVYDELLTQRAMCSFGELPAAASAHVEPIARNTLPPLDWDDAVTDAGFDGRALPYFSFELRISGGARLAQAIAKESAFECHEPIDELRRVAHTIPERPPTGLVALLAPIPRALDRVPWPAHGWTPGEILGYRDGHGAPPPKRGGTEWAIVWVAEADLHQDRVTTGGWIDQRGEFNALKPLLARDAAPTETLVDHMVVEVGDGEEARVGNKGNAKAGAGGSAFAGDEGTAVVGNKGTAQAGRYGTATAGMKGSALVGDHGTATAGHLGTAIAGVKGVAKVGRKGNAKAGVGGRVAGGTGAELTLDVGEGEVTAIAGKDVPADTLLRYLPEGSPQLYEGQPPGWTKAYS
ncbi:MAG: hypothetical protein AAGE52_08065 [Myxococcota bacterium]